MVCDADAAALKSGERDIYNSVENMIYLGQDAPPQNKREGTGPTPLSMVQWLANTDPHDHRFSPRRVWGRPAELHHGYQPASTATIRTMKKPSSPCTITPIQKLRKRLAAQAMPKELAIMLGQAQILCTW